MTVAVKEITPEQAEMVKNQMDHQAPVIPSFDRIAKGQRALQLLINLGKRAAILLASDENDIRSVEQAAQAIGAYYTLSTDQVSKLKEELYGKERARLAGESDSAL